jgi:hypothetical protein
MTKRHLLLGAFALAAASPAYAQFGVCDRAANDAVFLVNRDAGARVNNIAQSGDPDQVKNAHITIINWNRDNSLLAVRQAWAECAQGFRRPQQVVDAVVTLYTFGINRMLPAGMTHVDVSEVMTGHPLGGPGAVIPQIRETFLHGDNSTPANIIRDPIRCLTFRRKC